MTLRVIESTKCAQKQGTAKYVILVHYPRILSYFFVKNPTDQALIDNYNDLTTISEKVLRKILNKGK